MGTCSGSYVCPNKACSFLSPSQNKEANEVNFKNIRRSKQNICEICEYIAVEKECGAMKLVEFNPNIKIAIVYHIVKHRCWHKIDENSRKGALNRKQGLRRLGSAKQMGKL